MRKLTQFEQFLRDNYDNDGSIKFGSYSIHMYYGNIELRCWNFNNLNKTIILEKSFKTPESMQELFDNRMKFIMENKELVKELWYDEKLKELLNE